MQNIVVVKPTRLLSDCNAIDSPQWVVRPSYETHTIAANTNTLRKVLLV